MRKKSVRFVAWGFIVVFLFVAALLFRGCVNAPVAIGAETNDGLNTNYIPYAEADNYVYPFNTVSADWGSEVYEEGFRYYKIPEAYKNSGGCLPEVVQVYLWTQCKQRGVDYYIALALIEKESSYRWDACRRGDNSVGYMQIIEKWHRDRIKAENADLYNPYGNIRVGLNLLSELYGKYGDWNKVLMSYNMGEGRAKKSWKKGVYSNKYSTSIINRAQELQCEIFGV